jgi:hypothetical protein
MPWTVGDVEKHNKGLSAKQKAQWVAVANSHLTSCLKAGGTDATCAPAAIRMANGVVANSLQLHINTALSEYVIREVTHLGKKHIVVPVVMMVEGVHHGSKGPLLHPADELGHFSEAWNGRPVVVQHPVDENGMNISANSAEVIDSSAVGHVYNAHMNGNKLVADAYLEKAKLATISPEALTAVLNGNPLDVSIGVFTDEDETPGDWNGEQYTAIARNHRPDHLALLPGATGACSWNDGCGVRVNKEGGNMETDATVTGMETKRQELGMSVSEFYVVPRNPPSESKLPIFDAAHVRNALARINQTQGLSSEEKSSALSKIKAKAKHFNIDTGGQSNNELSDEKTIHIQSIINANIDANYRDSIEKAQRMIDSLDNQDASHYFQDMNSTHIVYEKRNRNNNSHKMMQHQYEMDANGTPQLIGNPTEVVQKTTYVPVTHLARKVNNNKGGNMKTGAEGCGQCMEKVIAIINSNANPFTASDREYLLAKEETFLDAIPVVKAAPVANAEPAKVEPMKLTRDMVLNALSAEDRAAMDFGNRELAARRQNWITGIQANTAKDTWTTADLTACNDDFLEKLYNSVKDDEEDAEVGNYVLNGRSIVQNNADDDDMLFPTGIEVK